MTNKYARICEMFKDQEPGIQDDTNVVSITDSNFPLDGRVAPVTGGMGLRVDGHLIALTRFENSEVLYVRCITSSHVDIIQRLLIEYDLDIDVHASNFVDFTVVNPVGQPLATFLAPYGQWVRFLVV